MSLDHDECRVPVMKERNGGKLERVRVNCCEGGSDEKRGGFVVIILRTGNVDLVAVNAKRGGATLESDSGE